jgi:hypothetical protein
MVDLRGLGSRNLIAASIWSIIVVGRIRVLYENS